MIKRNLSLIVVSVMSATALAQQSEIELAAANGIECFALAHGVNGLGSKREVVIPPFYTEGSGQFSLMVSNIGPAMVNVRLKLFDENGTQLDSDIGLNLDGKFTLTNNPLRKVDGIGAAILNSFEIGHVFFDNNVSRYYAGFLSWQADRCITQPTLSAIASQRFNLSSSRYGAYSLPINGGKPF